MRRGGSHHQKLVVDPTRPGPTTTSRSSAASTCATVATTTRATAATRRRRARPAVRRATAVARRPARGARARPSAISTYTFRERWEDPTPLDHRNPLRGRAAPRHRRAAPTRSAAAGAPDPPPVGTHAVQVLRTYPAKRPPYPFAPDGERSIARALSQGVRRARGGSSTSRTSTSGRAHAADALADALRRDARAARRRGRAALPRPERARRRAPPSRIGRERVTRASLRRAAATASRCTTSRTATGTPIYVHAKVCVVDDVLMVVGSDNLNRRSWTHDSEISCAVIDAELDEREPIDPGGLGDGARRLARDTRLRLWREHLGSRRRRRRRPRRPGSRLRRAGRRRGRARRVASRRAPRTPTAGSPASPRSGAGRAVVEMARDLRCTADCSIPTADPDRCAGSTRSDAELLQTVSNRIDRHTYRDLANSLLNSATQRPKCCKQFAKKLATHYASPDRRRMIPPGLAPPGGSGRARGTSAACWATSRADRRTAAGRRTRSRPSANQAQPTRDPRARR